MSRVYIPSFDRTDKAISSNELDEVFDSFAKALNGGLDVRNIKKGTKMSVVAPGSPVVSQAFAEPYALFTVRCVQNNTSLTDSIVGVIPAIPSGYVALPVSCNALFESDNTLQTGTVTFKKVVGSTTTSVTSDLSLTWKTQPIYPNAYTAMASTSTFVADPFNASNPSLIIATHSAMTSDSATFELTIKLMHRP